MDLEKLYSCLPDFIKYNNNILNFFLKIPKKIFKYNLERHQLESQNQLLKMLVIDGDIKFNGTLRDIQLLYVELLRFVDNVCKKHEINYWLDGGTLLGAVRHGGFIPWDDDVDLTMLRKDYNKLLEVLPLEISKHDYFKENCGLTLLIEGQKNYFSDFKSVYDVDNKEGYLNDDNFSFLQIAWLKPYVKIDFFPKDFLETEKISFFKKNYVSNKYKFNQKVKKGEYLFFKKLNEFNDKFGFVLNETPQFADSFDVIPLAPVRIFETSKTFPLNKISFEGYEFNCPNDVDYYLSLIYGKNFRDLPKVIETHNMADFVENQFASVDEMNEAFSKSVDYLKEINNNFDFE
ncbi:LicD family protein [Methanobrevibacter smithii]|uniref:LicD family protein n=1 Tax=Methanobrevibacter smithii TaxID=2173 RepID=UPI0030789B64